MSGGMCPRVKTKRTCHIMLRNRAQELDALFKKKSMPLGLIPSLERDAEYNKKEVDLNQLTEIERTVGSAAR